MNARNGILAGLLAIAWAGAGCDDSGSKPGGTSTGGAAAPVTPSPARDAAVAWAKALAAGDIEKARAASAGSEAELKAAEAYFAMGAAEAKLNAALKEKLGSEQTGGTTNALARQLEQSSATPDGDTVTLTHDDLNTPVTVREQADGTWKVDVADVAAAEQIFKHMAAGYGDAEVEVRDGKHATAEAAWQAASARIATRSGAPGGSNPPGGGGGGPGAGGPGGKRSAGGGAPK